MIYDLLGYAFVKCSRTSCCSVDLTLQELQTLNFYAVFTNDRYKNVLSLPNFNVLLIGSEPFNELASSICVSFDLLSEAPKSRVATCEDGKRQIRSDDVCSQWNRFYWWNIHEASGKSCACFRRGGGRGAGLDSLWKYTPETWVRIAPEELKIYLITLFSLQRAVRARLIVCHRCLPLSRCRALAPRDSQFLSLYAPEYERRSRLACQFDSHANALWVTQCANNA